MDYVVRLINYRKSAEQKICIFFRLQFHCELRCSYGKKALPNMILVEAISVLENKTDTF